MLVVFHFYVCCFFLADLEFSVISEKKKNPRWRIEDGEFCAYDVMNETLLLLK